MIDTQTVLWVIPLVMIVVALIAKVWLHKAKTQAEGAKAPAER